MSDTPELTAAIARLRLMELDNGDKWTPQEVRHTGFEDDLAAIATILNAVLDGSLIRAEAAAIRKDEEPNDPADEARDRSAAESKDQVMSVSMLSPWGKAALAARINGEFDNPELAYLGPLHTDVQKDIERIRAIDASIPPTTTHIRVWHREGPGVTEALKPCPFCGGPARTFIYNGATQASCAAGHFTCAGSDVTAPVAMWNRRARLHAGVILAVSAPSSAEDHRTAHRKDEEPK